MLNKAIIMGRLVKDPELRYTQANVPVCSFTIACERRASGKDNEPVTDFINVVAWRNTADFVAKFFAKGKPIIVEGQLQQRKFTTKDGEKRQVHEVVANSVYFCDSKKDSSEATQPDGNFQEISGDDEIPF